MTGFTGGCMCGAVRYATTADPVAFFQCYCRECQYTSGGEAASVVVVPRETFSITQGETKGYECTSARGNRVTRQFCETCGTPLFSDLGANPGIQIIKAGSVDESAGLKVSGLLWTSSAPAWSHLQEDVPHFEQDPPG